NRLLRRTRGREAGLSAPAHHLSPIPPKLWCPVGPDSPAAGSVLIARSVLTGSHGEEVTGLAVEHSAQRDEGGVSDGFGSVVLEHREIGQGDSDATGQLGQTHLLSPQQGIEVTDHAVRIELLHHHTSPS